MAKGGKRPGAGRKVGIRNKTNDEVRAIIDKVAKKHGGLETIFEKLFELTEGVTVRETDKKGNEFVYDQPPNAFAAKTLLEYRFGKPAQQIDLTTGGEKLSLQILYAKK